jgi:hypothetical protein
VLIDSSEFNSCFKHCQSILHIKASFSQCQLGIRPLAINCFLDSCGQREKVNGSTSSPTG